MPSSTYMSPIQWSFFTAYTAGPVWLPTLPACPAEHGKAGPGRWWEPRQEFPILDAIATLGSGMSHPSLGESPQPVSGLLSTCIVPSSSGVEPPTADSLPSSPLSQPTSPLSESSEPSLPPTAARLRMQGERCTHRKFWRRLRAKRGVSQFYCCQCKAKWRIRSLKKGSDPSDDSDEAADVLALEGDRPEEDAAPLPPLAL
eukprot:EG_transcript_23190